jgi:DNA-binding CsgD family transcriptional regulator
MMSNAIAAGMIQRHEAPRAMLFQRPAELVDVSEVIYRRVFAVGLWVAVGSTGIAMLSALLEPAGSRLSGLIACGICLAATICVAARPAGPYAQLRRRPQTLLVIGALLGAGAYNVGSENYELFLPLVTVIGVSGIATPLWVAIAAGLIATAGFGAPQFVTDDANLAPAMVIVVPPIMFWLIVDRIASFALRLHQALSDAPASASADPRPDEEGDSDQVVASHPGDPPSGSRAPLLLSQPRTIIVGDRRLTSRQLQVLLLACEGLRHAEIGACLCIGPQQVRRHLSAARARTNSASTPQLISWARRNGLTPGSETQVPRPQ